MTTNDFFVLDIARKKWTRLDVLGDRPGLLQVCWHIDSAALRPEPCWWIANPVRTLDNLELDHLELDFIRRSISRSLVGSTKS